MRLDDLIATRSCEPRKQIAANAAYFIGLTATAAYIGGLTFSIGHYIDNKGLGTFKRAGAAFGYGFTAGGEIGHSTSFRGPAISAEASGPVPGVGTSIGLNAPALSAQPSATFSVFAVFLTGTYTWVGPYIFNWK